VACEARQPVVIVTKNTLVTRDLDLLQQMASLRLVSVAVSVTSLEQSLTKVMEPRTSSPAGRLRTIEQLSQAGVNVQVLIAPVIPGLTDHEMPAILKTVKEAGAAAAGYVLLRLPLTVEPVFLEWLQRTHPDKRAKVESLVRSTRGGKLYDSRWGTRMSGRGEIAEQIRRTFQVFARKHGLDRSVPPLDCSQFRPPRPSSGQGWLFT
jgi:DNA repair photolyase